MSSARSALERACTAACPPWVAYAGAAALAGAYVLWLLPLRFLAGHGAYFELGDAAQHVSGWLFFRADSWRFPLLHTARLGYPEGTSIALTDSIPLMALALKPFAGALPEGFHYFGIWHGLAYVAQALASVLVVRVLGARSLAAALMAAAYGAMSPVVLARIGHSALMMQAVLPLAMGLYFAARRSPERGERLTLALLGTTVVALLIHPYLMAMSYGLFLACLLDRLRDGARPLLVLRVLAVSLGALLALGALLGYSSQGVWASGYGVYSMNLASPFCGGRFLTCLTDATGGQYEGFAYLGLGGLLVVACGAVARAREARALLAHYPGLLLFAGGCALFAVTNRVYAGPHLLASYELAPQLATLAGVFRASGRFAWVPFYLVSLGALASLLRSPRGVWIAALLVPVQWLDLAPLRERAAEVARLPSSDGEAGFLAVLAEARHLSFFPTFGCTALPGDLYFQAQLRAARAGLTLNTVYTARGVPTPCAVKNEQFMQPPTPDQIYAIPASELHKNAFGLLPGFRQALASGACALHRETVYCFARSDVAGWRERGAELEPVDAAALGALRELRFAPADLPSEIGAVVGGVLTPTAPDRRGYLNFGPYLSLERGRYRATLHYVSTADPAAAVGSWDVVGERSGTAVQLAAGPLQGSAGRAAELSVDLDLDERADSVQIRTYSQGGSDLQLREIRLAALDR